jgi:hypothetical protein
LENLNKKFKFLSKYRGDDELFKISKKLKQIDGKIEQMDQMVNMEYGCKLLANLSRVYPEFTQLKVTEDLLVEYLGSFQENQTILIERIQKFSQKLLDGKKSNLNIEGPLSDIAENLLTYVRIQNNPNFCVLHSTTTKELFEFYLSMLMKILRFFSLQEIIMEVKATHAGVAMQNEINILFTLKLNVVQRWRESLKNAFKLIKDDEDLFSCVPAKEEKKIVKFKNVLQVFFENDIAQQCNPVFKPELREKYDRKGCYGMIRNCTYLKSEKIY